MSARSFITIVTVLAIAALLTVPPSSAQDELEVKVTPLYHATFVLQFGDQTIIVDPVARADYRGFGEPDAILIPDVHPDHWNMETVALLMGTKTKVIAPAAVADSWGGIDTVLQNDGITDAAGIKIEAVPMYNLERGPRGGELYQSEGARQRLHRQPRVRAHLHCRRHRVYSRDEGTRGHQHGVHPDEPSAHHAAQRSCRVRQDLQADGGL